MRIGILGAFYECESTLREVLTPWKEYKETAEETQQIFITAIHCQFKEYADLGYQNDDKPTREILEHDMRDMFDALILEDHPLTENEVRTKALQKLLTYDVDLIWILDGDEIYKDEDIKTILSFVTEYSAPDFYKLNLKNYVFDKLHRLDSEFAPPRIFWIKRHGGLIGFEYDNSPLYRSGADQQLASHTIVPKHIAYIPHFTWQNESGKKKVAYQQKHFGYSMFRWNDEKNTLEFDPAYFAYWGDKPPNIYMEGE